MTLPSICSCCSVALLSIGCALPACLCLQCLPPSQAPNKQPAGTVTGVEENPKQLAQDLSCNCPRAAVAAKAVSVALAKSGNACGSTAGQALAREWLSGNNSGRLAASRSHHLHTQQV